MTKKKNYVDKEKFLNALAAYKKKCEGLKASEKPVIPDYIGVCIRDIAHGVAKNKNFSNYPFKEEMIEDGIENCFRYIDNFDPENAAKNPFGYFTQIIYFAFLRRIDREQKELYTKFKIIQQGHNPDNYAVQSNDDTTYGNDVGGFGYSDDYMNDFIRNYEAKLERKKNKVKEKE